MVKRLEQGQNEAKGAAVVTAAAAAAADAAADAAAGAAGAAGAGAAAAAAVRQLFVRKNNSLHFTNSVFVDTAGTYTAGSLAINNPSI